ncbi:MAG: beta-galactosidase trimerization domain-containing protein [Planctomycetota bacterium]|jgi:hypothetical protein
MVLSALLTAGGVAAAEEQYPEWVYKIRMVSIGQTPRKGKFDPEKTYQQALALKKQGVNTIMDHGSLQFLPDLPDDKAQWKSQVKWDIAVPYSEAIKKAGMKLFHHTTSTFVPIEALENPEYAKWVSLDMRTGKPSLRKPGTGYSDACFMDMNNPEFRKLIFSRMAEYAKRCNVDGWMTDEVQWLADVYASGSKDGAWKKFKQIYGHDYPAGKVNYADPKWRKYISFRYDSGGDFYKALLKELQTSNQSMMISGCLAGISKYWRRDWAQGSENWLTGWNLGFFEMEEAHCLHGKRAGFLSTTFWPAYYKEMSLYNANGEINGWPCSYALGYPRRWKCENSEQFYLWAQSLTMGFRFWMRDYQAEPQWFEWEAKYEQDLVKPKLIGDIGIFFPEWTRDFSTDPKPTYKNWSGVSEALAWENVCADQLIRKHLEDIKRIERFKLIIMPSNVYLSDKMTETLKQFVSNGGTLLAIGVCTARDPFTGDNYGNPMMELLGISWRPKWIAGKTSFTLNSNAGPLPAGEYILPDGLLKVKAALGAEVLANMGGVGPAVIKNNFGKGTVYYITGRWGLSMYDDGLQKEKQYKPTYDPKQRELFAKFVSNILENKRNVEVNGLPAKVMVNAYDTDGDFDGKYKRTIHILDSFDGFEEGETFPKKNQPCKFKQFAERNGGKSIEVILRNLTKVNSVKMISPDFEQPKELEAVYSKESNGYVINIKPEEFGRYSILVVDKEK